MSPAVLALCRGAGLALSRHTAYVPALGCRLVSTSCRYDRVHSRFPWRETDLDAFDSDDLHHANEAALAQNVYERYLEWAFDTVGMPAPLLGALGHLQDLQVVLKKRSSPSPKPAEESNMADATLCALTARLWNLLSLEYTARRPARSVNDLASQGVVVCMPTGHRPALGHYLGDKLKLDYSFSVAPYAVLKALVAHPNLASAPPLLSSILGPGGHTRLQKVSYRQLASSLEVVKKYRVDLPTVHGFQLSENHIVLGSLNACGLWISPNLPVSDIRPWIAHIGLLYHAWETRIQELNHHIEQTEFARWDVSFGARRRALVPFFASRAPGRCTSAGFVLAQTPCLSGDEATMKRSFGDEDAQGFWKLSWQDIRKPSREAVLLQRLHTPRYIPGLVRPTFAHRDADHNAIAVAGGTSDSIRRVKDVIELGSVGKPLSQGRSPRHLLYAFYDLVETLRALTKKNVLHRDVSWYNTLIDPIHTVDDGRGVEPHRCISQVMFATGLDVTERPFGRRARTAGVTVFESCALLTDFDHSVDKSISDEAASRENIGTPMFISVERSRPSACRFNLPLDAVSLLAQLCEVENSDKGRKLFKAAFPAGDGDFMDWFKSMIDAEYVRRSQDIGSNPRINHDGRHEVRHDVESAWWTYLWAFARARPRASMLEAETSAEACSFDSFAGAMLNHAADGTSRDWDRAKYLFSAFNVESLFHPRLAVFERLFMALGSYLSIPWHLYSGMPEDHILTACQRLILATLVFDDVDLDVELDTEQPRITAVLDGSITLTGPAASTRSDIDNTRPAIIATRTAPFTRKTRKGQRAMSTPMPSFPHSSLPTVRRAHQLSLRMKRFVRSVAGRQRRKDKQASDYDVYMHDIHLDLRTPHALRLMVWKDKELWFGSGRRKTK